MFIGLGLIFGLSQTVEAQIMCEIVRDPSNNLKATVKLSGSGTSTGTAANNFGAVISNGTGTFFNAPNGVEVISGRTVGTIPASALTFSYGNTTHDVSEVIFRATADDIWFQIANSELFNFSNGETVSASGTFVATFAPGSNGETLADLVPGTYNGTMSDSGGNGSIPFTLKISDDNSAKIAQLKRKIKKLQKNIKKAKRAGDRRKARKLTRTLKRLKRQLSALR